jgi:hypothetical protein
MKFSKEQYEGFARFIDTIAASALIGGIVGATGHSPLSTTEIVTLLGICPILLGSSAYVRRPR